MNLEEAGALFIEWLEARVLSSACGADVAELDVEPSGRFWLGRLASQEAVIELGLGDRGERLDPCAMGMRLRPKAGPPWRLSVEVSARAWLNAKNEPWRKSGLARQVIDVEVSDLGEFRFGRASIEDAFSRACSKQGLSAELLVEVTGDASNREIAISLVNVSPKKHPEFKDTNIYECELRVRGLGTEPYLLEALPDSFRYDRRVPAYGINGGVVEEQPGVFRTAEIGSVQRGRPEYWETGSIPPDLRFDSLAKAPLPSLRELIDAMARWGDEVWSAESLDTRATGDLWTDAMRAQAEAAAGEFRLELDRLREGLAILESDHVLLRSFRLMNDAIGISAKGRYERWRPFQMGFLLANIASIANPERESETADIVWFATGGGKTETYLGLIVMAAIHDRLTGKSSGVTAWSRFPLRMLSLQQTQRFANAMAGAEIVRQREGIDGDPFSCGFLVGQGGTPNRLRPDPPYGQPDPDDPDMPGRYQVLLECPFCSSETLSMALDRRHWSLEHRCNNDECPWPEPGLPFYIVDDEIYRFLPTVVVGTLDKVASVALQTAMRGLFGAPKARCKGAKHGYTYAPRSKAPTGCLVPGCRFDIEPFEQAVDRFGPSFRLQDELHLLKDSLGAVDAHYESLLDHLQCAAGGSRPKVLASSATLTGYDKQVEVLYRRAARVFPRPGPSVREGFWSRETDRPARRFVAVAPRGATLEYAVDRTTTILQTAIREVVTDPVGICQKIGIDPKFAADLVSLYGVDVIYGNTLRDLEAVTRSLETQVPVDGSLRTASLTGRTEFEEVRRILERLEKPEPEFDDRIHVVSASAMMSHGVDIDRLNLMVMLGLPLTTAEFIQSTARVGRRWPGLVFVMHKIGRERDAAMYRSFEKFVTQGDRFVEPVPITRRSRRVLERTIAGFELARILAIHEFSSPAALTTVKRLREYFQNHGIGAEDEIDAVVDALGLTGELDEYMRDDLRFWFEGFFRNLNDPAGTFTFPSDLAPLGGPMISLRDVEEQAPILGLVDR